MEDQGSMDERVRDSRSALCISATAEAFDPW